MQLLCRGVNYLSAVSALRTEDRGFKISKCRNSAPHCISISISIFNCISIPFDTAPNLSHWRWQAFDKLKPILLLSFLAGVRFL